MLCTHKLIMVCGNNLKASTLRMPHQHQHKLNPKPDIDVSTKTLQQLCVVNSIGCCHRHCPIGSSHFRPKNIDCDEMLIGLIKKSKYFVCHRNTHYNLAPCLLPFSPLHAMPRRNASPWRLPVFTKMT